MAAIDGTSGNDSLTGTSGNDTIRGFGGNDLIRAGSTGGADVIDGGAGTDSIEFKERATSAVVVDFVAGTISGGSSGTISFSNVERIVAGNFNDSMTGSATGQTLTGQAGADTLWGAGGIDTLWGGTGADRFIFRETGTGNADLVRDWASGSDKLLLDGAVMSALGATGNFAAGDARFKANSTGTATDASDRVIYNTSNGQVWYDADGNGAGARQLIATLQSGATLVATDLVVEGGSSGQTINGTSGNDTLVGGPGNDTINGLSGSDSLVGGEGRDVLTGGDGDDTLDGWFSENFFDEEEVPDTLNGGLGNDVFRVDNAGDALTDSGGMDTVRVKDLDWTLAAGYENLVIHNDTAEHGFTGIGNELDNHIAATYAGSRLEGRGGDDTLIGAGGNFGSNQLFGGEGNDSLVGAESGDEIDGGGGNDTLSGGENDEGPDRLTGGAGADSFIFGQVRFESDTITDFASGEDRIRLDAREMPELGASGTLSADDPRFHAAEGAFVGHDADDRIIYDTASGRLYFDPDGSGARVASLIATLNSGGGAAPLAATDITIDNGAVTRTGTAGNDSLVGDSGNDSISGLGGNDTLIGLGGHDTLDGGAGVDRLEGGLHDDTYFVTAGDVIIEPADGGFNDIVIADVSWTLGQGQDHLILLEGAAGAVEGRGNAGRNSLQGNSGNNVLDGGDMEDTLSGGAGNDTLTGAGFDVLHGDAGNDVLRADWTLTGGEGHDRLEGGISVWGDAGNDTMVSGAGNAELSGGLGADTFVVAQTPNADRSNWDRYMDFTTGEDEMRFDGRVFTQIGASGDFAAGDERFYAAPGANAAHDATDRLIYNTSTGDLWYDPDGSGAAAVLPVATLRDWRFSAQPANLQATDIAVDNGSAPPAGGQVINGTPGNDTLSGTSGNDTINGLGGNDLFLAGSTGGSDVIDGGADRDSIEFKERAISAVVVDYASGTITGGSSGSISFTSIERVVGGNFNDSLSGTVGSQTLTGQAGADTLTGGAGNDTLWGGTGNDAFVFNGMGSANADRISDFASGQDKVQLDDTAFTGIGATGNFATGDARFWASSSGAAHDSNDRVLYNTSTGQLYYDADGSGSGAAQLIATISGNPTVAATDIAVI